VSEKWRQSEICIVINDKSQSNIAEHLRCDKVLYYTFIIKSAGERIFEIDKRFASKLQDMSLLTFALFCKANIVIVLVDLVASVAGQPTVESCYKITGNEERCFKATRSSEYLRTWPVALDWCYNQSGGYSLAAVRDEATQEALAAFLYDHELTSRNVWIGARQSTGSRWAWLDGTNESGESSRVQLSPASIWGR